MWFEWIRIGFAKKKKKARRVFVSLKYMSLMVPWACGCLRWLLASITMAALGGISEHWPIVCISLFYLSCKDLSSQRTSSKCNWSAVMGNWPFEGFQDTVSACRCFPSPPHSRSNVPCRYTPVMSELFIFACRPLWTDPVGFGGEMYQRPLLVK